MVHSYLVNMLILCMKHKGKAVRLDVSHIMWEELYSAVMDRKVPIYGPYLQRLFEVTWSTAHEGQVLPTGELTSHEVVQLRRKDRWAGGHAPAQASLAESEEVMADETATDVGGGSSARGAEKPGWDAKLVAQFFATVYFSTNTDRTMTWMCHDRRVSCKWKDWMMALDIQDQGLDEALGLRPHTNKASKPKSKLASYQTITFVIDANGKEKNKVVFIP